MTSSEPTSEDQGAEPSPKVPQEGQEGGGQAGVLGAVWEWLWQPSRARLLKLRAQRRSDRQREFTRRAQASLEAAEQVVQLRDAEGDLVATPLVADLLRQSAHWASLAVLEDDPGDAPPPEQPRLDVARWDKVRQRVALHDSDGLWEEWLGRSFEHAWENPAPRERVTHFLNVATALCEFANGTTLEFDRLWFRRIYRLGIPLVALALGAGALGYANHRKAVAAETAYPWKTSSSIGGGDAGCTSPSQDCAEVRYFFHTREETNPWIEFDLGREANLDRIKIANRNDCPECPKRATPLVVEVSQDHEEWTEVGRHQDSFENWDLKLSTGARWVRMRALKRTFLHFRQVRIQAR